MTDTIENFLFTKINNRENRKAKAHFRLCKKIGERGGIEKYGEVQSLWLNLQLVFEPTHTSYYPELSVLILIFCVSLI